MPARLRQPLLWIAVITLIVPASAQEPKGPVNTFVIGIGRLSCANWLSTTAKEAEGRTWILGYWAAVNMMNDTNHIVGSHSDAEAIFGEVKKICIAEPSTNVADAVTRVYFQFQKEGK